MAREQKIWNEVDWGGGIKDVKQGISKESESRTDKERKKTGEEKCNDVQVRKILGGENGRK